MLGKRRGVRYRVDYWRCWEQEGRGGGGGGDVAGEAESETMKWDGGEGYMGLRRYFDTDGAKVAPNYHKEGS